MEQESVARLMKAEMDAKKEVDDAKKGASHPQPRPLKASHIPEPSARALCSVLRARELGGRGPRGTGGRR